MRTSPSSSPLGTSSGSSSSLGENFITSDTTWLPTSTVRPNARFSTTKMLRGGCRYTCSGSSCKRIMHGVHRGKADQPVLSYQTVIGQPYHVRRGLLAPCSCAQNQTLAMTGHSYDGSCWAISQRFCPAAEPCGHGRAKSWRQFPSFYLAPVATVHPGMAESTLPLTTSMYFTSSVKLGFSL